MLWFAGKNHYYCLSEAFAIFFAVSLVRPEEAIVPIDAFRAENV
jgi:hypothetical protein